MRFSEMVLRSLVARIASMILVYAARTSGGTVSGGTISFAAIPTVQRRELKDLSQDIFPTPVNGNPARTISGREGSRSYGASTADMVVEELGKRLPKSVSLFVLAGGWIQRGTENVYGADSAPRGAEGKGENGTESGRMRTSERGTTKESDAGM